METYQEVLAAFLQWLLKTTLQGSLLVCLIMLIKMTLRERLPARWHYCLWLILLVRLSLPWSPQSRLSIYSLYRFWQWDRPVPSAVESSSVQSPADRQQKEPGQTRTDSSIGKVGVPKAIASEPPDTQRQPESALPVLRRGLEAHWLDVEAVLPPLWFIGVIVLGSYVLARNIRLWRAITSERPVTDQQIMDLLEDCKTQMRIRTIVAVVVTDRIGSPALFGFVRPRILLPQGLLEAISLDELGYVFLHELAHLKRRDIYLAWLICLLQVLHWFNPLIWFAFRRMRTDQEMAADAAALATAGREESYRYGQTIVSLLERFSRPQYLPSLAGILENPSHIERRMAMIARFTKSSYRWSPLGLAAVAVLGIVSMIDPTRGAVSTSPTPQAKPGVTIRSVERDSDVYSYVGVSPDGRYLCGFDTWQARGEIAVREIVTSEEHVIKPTKETPQEGGPRCPVISPDNKTIAYLVERPGATDDNLQSADVRLIGADGSGQRVLCRGAVSGGRVVRLAPKPIQWFPDGSRLLALAWPDRIHARNSIEIVSVSIEDGAVQVIKKLTGNFARTHIRLSPDGKYVAYELPSQDAPENHDIFALELDSNQETLLVGHAANDSLLDWTPDGSHILFSSERLGPRSVWLLPVAQGRAQGTPRLVVQSAGDMRPIGFAQNGAYFYSTWATAADIYTAKINTTTAQLVSAPVPLEGGGFNQVADWSPDGKYLAYGSRPVTAPQSAPGVIRIRSLATGEERELVNKLAPFDCLRWSPDGHSLLVSGLRAYRPEDIAFTGRVYRIDAATGEPTVLLENKVDNWVMMAELSPGGKTLYYWQAGIVRREIDTGQETTLLTPLNKGPWASWALSPNGEFIATGFNEGTGRKGPRGEMEGGVKKVLLIPSQGGEATELVRWDQEPASFLTHTCWSPDGKTVLFTLSKGATTEFWQVSIDGGEPCKIMETDLGMLGRRGFRVHPDGQRIAFPSATGSYMLWAMENFLPAAKAAGTSTSVTTLQPAVVSGSPASQVKAPVSMRLIQEEVWGDVSMSPDRRYLCHTGWEQGEIFIRELATGEQRTIKSTKRVPEESKPSSPILSPDNKIIAYHVGFRERSDVCLIGTDGSGQRVLYPGIIRSALEPAGSGPALPYPGNVRPVQWFPDGSRFLAMRWPDVMHFFNDIEIVSVSLADGSTEIIKKLTGEFYGTTIRLSPDAKAVAYELASKDTPKKRDIFAIDIDSKQETPLVVHAANDRLLDWTPDGRHILFVSDRMGPWSIWLVPVTMGQGQGVPELVGRSTGPIGPVGFAEDGSYCYRIAYRDTDIHTAVVDLATSQLLSAPARLGVTGSDVADWSPDGKYLAYCAPSAASSEQRVIRIRSLDTGQEREIPDKVTGFNYLRWSPDGRSLLASGLVAYKPEDVLLPSRVYRIDAVIGDSMILLDTKEHEVRMAELSPDGKILYYTTNTIIRREIDSGQERILFTYSPKAPWAGSALSPNGEFIAVASNEGTKEKAEGGVKKILLIPSQGGQATELLRWDQEAASFLTQTGWSGDGKTVLFTLHREPVAGKNPKEVNEFWQVSIEGGEPRKIFETDLHIQHSRCFRVHPDGQRIAFSVTTAHGELWAMENFLPASAALPQTK